MKSEMQRAVVKSMTMFGRYWHRLSFEERHEVLEAVRAEMRGEVVAPRDTREHELMKKASGRINLGSLPGGAGK
jgi:hypothetical protein